ncbi:hypothetical protein [Bartonella raoultii]|uniref:Uncharacterized protein n=1 Tax=Bartonella raoultii TaxID=1457020 RepID=A0ABS7I6Q2_9HYPH|nr:hypothetical protein [Bartonella raoultii]MBX4336555.1 hypothetical protein [Bartonella raoultii]
MPSRLIIKYLGGLKTVANIVQRDVSSVCRWRNFIPAKHQQRILNYARDHGIDLRPDDFFYPERLQSLMQEQESSSISRFVKNSHVHSSCDILRP